MKKWRFAPFICVSVLMVVMLFFVFTNMQYARDPYPEPPTTESPEEEIIVTEPSVEEPTEPPTEPPPVEHLIDNNAKYVGCYVENVKEVNPFNGAINMLGWFDTFDKVSTTKIGLCLDDHQYVAFITLEPEGMSLTDIVKGHYDEKIISYLQELSRDDRIHTELFIRLMHEMEMRPAYSTPWYSWQGYDAELYIDAWKHIVTLGREYAPNVKWVWSPNRADDYTPAYYPGDEYVDYVGMSLNNTRSRYADFKEFYEIVGTRQHLEAYNKPIIFSEVAEHNFGTEKQGDYLVSVLEYLSQDEKCVGVVFFNKNVTSDRKYQFTHDEVIMDRIIQITRELFGIGEEEKIF